MNIDQEAAALERTSTIDLRKKFAQLCGYPTENRNRTWLIRRIAWRFKLTLRGARAAELANEAELRVTGDCTQIGSIGHPTSSDRC